MANNFDAQVALQFTDGATPSVLSIVEAKVLKILQHRNLGLYVTATAMNPNEFIHGGTAIYRLPQIMGVKDYAADGSNKQIPTMKMKEIKLSINKEVLYEVEGFDLQRLFKTCTTNEDIANAIVANWDASAIASIKTYFDCQLFKQWSTQAKATTVGTGTNQVTVTKFGKLDASLTKDNAVGAYAEFSSNVNRLEQTFSSTQLGCDRSELFAIVKPDAFSSAVAAGASMYTNDASIVDGHIGAAPGEMGNYHGTFDGLKIFRSPLLGKTLAKGTLTAPSFDFVNDYDFSKTVAFIAHFEAAAIPISGLESAVNKNYNNNNFVFIHKFNHGIGDVRTDMVIELVIA